MQALDTAYSATMAAKYNTEREVSHQAREFIASLRHHSPHATEASVSRSSTPKCQEPGDTRNTAAALSPLLMTSNELLY